jgi:hypothetical protein
MLAKHQNIIDEYTRRFKDHLEIYYLFQNSAGEFPVTESKENYLKRDTAHAEYVAFKYAVNDLMQELENEIYEDLDKI